MKVLPSKMVGKTTKVMAITLVGMVIGLISDILIATKLGLGTQADSIIVALGFPLFLDTVLREGTRFSLVPIYMETLNKSEKEGLNRFVSGMMNLFLFVGFVLYLVLNYYSSSIVSVLGPGLSDEGHLLALNCLRNLWPMVIVLFQIAIISGWLNVYDCFEVVVARNLIMNLGIVLSMLLFWEAQTLGHYITLGYLLASFFFFLILLATAFKKGFEYKLFSLLSVQEIKKVFKAILFPSLGIMSRQLSRLGERSIATLVAVGGVASYYFAFRVFVAFQNIVGMSLALTGVSGLSKRHIDGDMEGMGDIIKNKIIASISISICATVFILIFGEELIMWLYGHGSFGGYSVEVTTKILTVFSLGFLPAATIPIFNSGIYAHKRFDIIFYSAFLVSLLNIFLAFWFSRSFGLSGIALGSVFSALFEVILLCVFVRRLGLVPPKFLSFVFR